MPKGAFLVSGEGTEIVFEQHPDVPQAPEDQIRLYVKFASLHSRLRALFDTDAARLEHYVRRLRSIAQVSISGKSVDPALGEAAYTQLVADIVDREGWRIKLGYLRQLGLVSGGMSAAALVLYVVLINCTTLQMLGNYALLFIGSQIGVFLSVAARRSNTSMDELMEVRHTRWEPFVRLLYTGLLALTLGLLLAKGAITLAFGQFNAGSFITDIPAALLTGLIMGLAEKTLSLRLSSQVEGAVKKSLGDSAADKK